MPVKMEKSGYIFTKDPRNFVSEAVQPVKAFPPSFTTDITPFKAPANILMQGQQPSCVAHSVCWYMEYLIWKKTGNIVKLSPRFLYTLCKQQDGMSTVEGTNLVTALKIAQKNGICEESYFPSTPDLITQNFSSQAQEDKIKAIYKDASLITPEAYQNASTHRIAMYSFLSDLSFAGLCNAIYQNGVILLGLRIGPQWWEAANGEVSWDAADILPLRPANPVVSGHAIVLYAYSQAFIYLMNWWSAGWGYVGRGWFDTRDTPFIYESAIIHGLFDPTSPAPPTPPQKVLPVGWGERLWAFIKSLKLT